jgi:hypothetical protein
MRPDRSQKTSTLADVIPNWAGTPIRFWRRFTQEESGLQFLHQRPVPDATTVSRLRLAYTKLIALAVSSTASMTDICQPVRW